MGAAKKIIQQVITAALIDLFDMKDRLKYQPLINTAFGITFIIGPSKL
jgi:hypothetical protein